MRKHNKRKLNQVFWIQSYETNGFQKPIEIHSMIELENIQESYSENSKNSLMCKYLNLNSLIDIRNRTKNKINNN